MNEQQKKEILESDSFGDYCSNSIKCANCAIGYTKDCSAEFYKIKFEAEKANVKKLKKCVEFYANPDEMGKGVCDHCGNLIGYVNSKDFEKVDGGDLHYGKHARETLKEIGE